MKRFSLPFKERIHKAGEFQLVYRRGKKIVTDYFVWFLLGDEKCKPARRLGITVTKGVGKANQRNRIKRQVREFFRLNKERFPSGSLVVKARMGASKVNNKALREDMRRGLGNLFNEKFLSNDN